MFRVGLLIAFLMCLARKRDRHLSFGIPTGGKEENVLCGMLRVAPFRKWRPNSAGLCQGDRNN